MQVFAGYAVTFLYIFFLIFGIGTLVKKFTDVEISRKVIHTLLFVVWVLIDRFFKGTVHQIIIPVAFIVLNAASYKFGIYKAVERESDNHLGTVYFAVAVTVIMTVAYFVPEFYFPSGIAVMCLTLGDGLAAIIGHVIPTRKIYGKKSMGGSVACAVTAALAVFGFCRVYGVELSAAQMITVGLAAAIFELTGRGLDNFTITFGTFLMSYAYMWLPPERLLLSIFTAIAVFLIVFLSGAIEYYGALLAMVIVFTFSYCGGSFGLAFLLAAYFTIFAVAVIKRKRAGKTAEKHGRNFLQIAINGLIGTVFTAAYGVTADVQYLVLGVIAIGGCFVDSVSSDVGVMSGSEPYDLLRGEWVKRGISGGVSVLGTASALVCSAVIAASLRFAAAISVGDMAVIAALIFGQTVLDSLLGSAVQVKYVCAVCGEVTEKKMHCGCETKYLRGVRWVNNNAVNMISSIAVSAAAFIAVRFLDLCAGI